MSYFPQTKQVNNTMKTFHSTFTFILALLAGTLLMGVTACKKSPETIGNGLISDDNVIGIYRTDTLQILSYSYLDTIGTMNVSYGLLGSMNDPVFGLSQAGFCTQLHLSSIGQHFGDNPVLDSLVMQLSLSDYYGDTLSWQTIHIYELTDSLSSSGEYKNYSVVSMNEAVDHANSFMFRPRPKTHSHIIGTDTVNHAVIRIPLSDQLGNYLLTLDSTAYKEPDLFKQYFPGLCLKCEPANGTGCINYISMTDNTNTLLKLYYHDAATPNKPMSYNFYITSADTYFNQISHDYSMGDAEFVSQLLEGSTELGQQKVYLQTMGGVRTKIMFPNLSQWADTLDGHHIVINGTDTLYDCHIVINEAKLILPAVTFDSTIFSAPKSLIVVGLYENDSTYILPDYYEGSSYFGGSFNTTTNRAFFRISEYMQDVILGNRPNCGISLGINGAAYNARRLILNGPDVEDNPMRVEISYSIVQE